MAECVEYPGSASKGGAKVRNSRKEKEKEKIEEDWADE
jgi:hypothetical protein